MNIINVTYITELSDQSYDEFIKKNIVLIDIYANWCSPCKQISPIIDDLSIEYLGKVSIGKVDADKCPDIIKSTQIKSIPTILLYKGGELVERVVGLTSKQKLSDTIKKYL
jgi:thioredoxin 1